LPANSAERVDLGVQGSHVTVPYAQRVSLNSSRPISIRRISLVPAPISYSLASQQAAGREFVDVAVAAEDLDRLQGHLRGAFGGVQDHPGGVLAGGLAAVAGLGHGIQVGAAGVELGVHVGDLALDQLELADALAELLAVVDVGHDQVHAACMMPVGPPDSTTRS
jgi:hypothetical protein